MPIEPEDLEELIEKIRLREENAKKELEQADTAAERKELRERLENLETRNAELEKLLAGTDDDDDQEHDDDETTDADELERRRKKTPPAKKKTRPGRKKGNVYQDSPGDAAYVYQGEDEPDEVELDDEDAA